MSTLTGTEKRMIVVAIVKCIRDKGFKVEIHIFSDHCRIAYPEITTQGILNLWQLYQLDRTI